jgi:hypothetical protein
MIKWERMWKEEVMASLVLRHCCGIYLEWLRKPTTNLSLVSICVSLSPLGRPRRRWVDNIKMDLREIGWDGMDWIELAQDRDQ